MSERLLRFGFEPAPGDLVFDPESLGKKSRDKKRPDAPTPAGADDDEGESGQLSPQIQVELTIGQSKRSANCWSRLMLKT